MITVFLLLVIRIEITAIQNLAVEKVIKESQEREVKINTESQIQLLKAKVKELEEDKKKAMTFSMKLTYPLKDFDAKLSQGYGQNLLAYGGMGLTGHPGIDLVAPEGTPVYSAHAGIVFEAFGRHDNAIDGKVGYGNRVKLRARIGSQGQETVYAHLSKVEVRIGEFVEDGQLIGYSGDTGFSTRPHLHFGVRYLWYCDKGGTQVSHPCEVLNGGNGMMGWVDPRLKLM